MKTGKKEVIIHPDGRYLQLDEFERELLQHYLKLSLETLKRRLPRAKSLTSTYLMEFTFGYKWYFVGRTGETEYGPNYNPGTEVYACSRCGITRTSTEGID